MVSFLGNTIFRGIAQHTIYVRVMVGFKLIHLKWFRYGGGGLEREWNVCMKPFQIHSRNNLAQSPHAGKNIYDNQKVFPLQYSIKSRMKIRFPGYLKTAGYPM